MASEFVIEKRVEFSDTDMAGIMHFSNFFRFMEAAEHAFFRALGFSVSTVCDGQHYGWPRVHAECDYKRPLRFEDLVSIRLQVIERREKTIHYDIQFWNVRTAELAAVGRLVVACIQSDSKGGLRAVPIPAEIAKLIEPAARMEKKSNA